MAIQQLSNLNDVSEKQALDLFKLLIIPELVRDVNFGANFAKLRQIYTSILLANWYKKTLRLSLDLDLVRAVGDNDSKREIELQAIYGQYLDAYKVGVFNYIREDASGEDENFVPRKYFSGGFSASQTTAQTAVRKPSLLVFKGRLPSGASPFH